MQLKPVSDALDEQIERKKIRKEMFEEEWMVMDGTLTLLQECSDAAMDGNAAGHGRFGMTRRRSRSKVRS